MAAPSFPEEGRAVLVAAGSVAGTDVLGTSVGVAVGVCVLARPGVTDGFGVAVFGQVCPGTHVAGTLVAVFAVGSGVRRRRYRCLPIRW